MKEVLGVLTLLFGFIAAALVGLGMLAQGVVVIIDGAKADPTNTWSVRWGIVWMLLAPVAAYLIADAGSRIMLWLFRDDIPLALRPKKPK